MQPSEKRFKYMILGSVILLVLYSITGQEWMLVIAGPILFILIICLVMVFFIFLFGNGKKLLSNHKEKGKNISHKLLIEKEWRYLLECNNSGHQGIINLLNHLIVHSSFGILTSEERPFFVKCIQSTEDFLLVWNDSFNWWGYKDDLIKMLENFNQNYQIDKLENVTFKIHKETIETVIQKKINELSSIYILSNFSDTYELEYFVFFRINKNRAEIIGFLYEL